MILKSYLFCLKQNRYIQYPNDHTASFLRPLCGRKKDRHQVVVYRDGGLMYYCYLYDTQKNETIGLCIATGSLCTNIKTLYDNFINCFDFFAKRGTILCFGHEGEVQTVSDFTQNTGEVEELFKWFQDCDETNKLQWETLPPEDHTITKGASVAFNFEDDNNQRIVEATRHYTYVTITLHNPAPSCYSETVKRLSAENATLNKKNENLTKQIEIINKRKKQYRSVIGLTLALLFGAIISIITISDKNIIIKTNKNRINDQHETIQAYNETIVKQNDIISEQTNKIDEQTIKITELIDNSEELSSKYDSLKNEYLSITSAYPIKITSIDIGNTYKGGLIETEHGYTLYSSKTMFLQPKISYYGYISGFRDIKIKWFNKSGELIYGNDSPIGYSQGQSVYFHSGFNDISLQSYGNETKGNWSSGTYRIEIWYKNMCLRSKTFTIY